MFVKTRVLSKNSYRFIHSHSSNFSKTDYFHRLAQYINTGRLGPPSYQRSPKVTEILMMKLFIWLSELGHSRNVNRNFSLLTLLETNHLSNRKWPENSDTAVLFRFCAHFVILNSVLKMKFLKALLLKTVLGYENLDAIPFPKDQASDHAFPPKLQRSPNMPFGHLRPLGTQRRAEGQVNEFDAKERLIFCF